MYHLRLMRAFGKRINMNREDPWKVELGSLSMQAIRWIASEVLR